MEIRLKHVNIWLIILIVLFVIPITGSEYVLSRLFLIFIYASLGTAWNFLTSKGGVVNLGQQIFIGVGGYLIAISTLYWGIPSIVGVILGALVSIIIAIGLSYPLFRLRGIYFAIGSWMAAATFFSWFQSWDYIKGGFGLTIRIGKDISITMLYYSALVLTFISILLTYYIARSKLGYGLITVASGDEMAKSLGINSFRIKQYAFIYVAIISAIAGSLYFLHAIYITPNTAFRIDWILILIFVATVGGTGRLLGSTIGAIVYVILRDMLYQFQSYFLLLQGLIIFLIVLFLPTGILGMLKEKIDLEIFLQEKE